MQAQNKKRLMLFTGSANPELATEVADLLGVELGNVSRKVFASGEISVSFQDSVRGADCFVLQSHFNPINFHIMEQLIMLDALERASARRITAVVPFYGYARQDKKGRPREPITARLMGDLLLTSGADRIVSVDLHSAQLPGLFRKPFDHITALPTFLDYISKSVDRPLTIVSPDTGRVKLASRYARRLDVEVAFVHKRRSVDEANVVAALQVVGDVKGRHCILMDDMIDAGGTICSAAELLKEGGALSIRAMATHGVFSPPAAERLRNAPIDEVVVTNTLPISDEIKDLPNLTVLSIAPSLAATLRAIFEDESVSSLFMGENV